MLLSTVGALPLPPGRGAPSRMNKCESFCFDFFYLMSDACVFFILYCYYKRTKREVLLQSIVCMKTKHKSVTILVEKERERFCFHIKLIHV